MPFSSRSFKAFLAGILVWICAPAQGQSGWNPDYNNDGVITAADLTGFLTAWEMPVDSVVRSAWEIHCDQAMDGQVPLDSVTFTLAAMDIQLRDDGSGEPVLDTAWVDQEWVITNIPVEFNHIRFFGPTPFVTGQISYHPDSDSYLWYMEFNESTVLNPEDNRLGELQDDGWFQNIYVFEELFPYQPSVLAPHGETWYLSPRYSGYANATWTVLDFSVTFHGAP